MPDVATLLRERAAQQRQLAARYAEQLDGTTDLEVLRQAEIELLGQLEEVRARIKIADRYRVATETAEWLEGQAARRSAPPLPADALTSTGLPVQPATPAPVPTPAAEPAASPGPAETMPDTTPTTGSARRLPFRLGAMGPARPTPRETGPDDTPPMTEGETT